MVGKVQDITTKGCMPLEMIDELKRQIGLYLPKMEIGSTFLDAGCHKGEMYDLLINKMRLDIHYTGPEPGHENIIDTIKVFKDSRFNVVII